MSDEKSKRNEKGRSSHVKKWVGTKKSREKNRKGGGESGHTTSEGNVKFKRGLERKRGYWKRKNARAEVLTTSYREKARRNIEERKEVPREI